MNTVQGGDATCALWLTAPLGPLPLHAAAPLLPPLPACYAGLAPQLGTRASVSSSLMSMCKQRFQELLQREQIKQEQQEQDRQECQQEAERVDSTAPSSNGISGTTPGAGAVSASAAAAGAEAVKASASAHDAKATGMDLQPADTEQGTQMPGAGVTAAAAFASAAAATAGGSGRDVLAAWQRAAEAAGKEVVSAGLQSD